LIGEERPVRHSLGSEIGLAHFGAETKHETKPNLPNSADSNRMRVLSPFYVPQFDDLVPRLGSTAY